MFDVLIESDPNLKPRKTALSLAISVVLHGVILVLARVSDLDTVLPAKESLGVFLGEGFAGLANYEFAVA